MNSHMERHWTAPTDSAEPAGPTTRAETAAPARAALKAASPSADPAAFLAAHPLAYGLSLAGSGAAAIYGLTVARQDPRHRVLWLALGAHCTAQFAGIVIATEVARRRSPPADGPASATESHATANPGPESIDRGHDQ